MAKPSDYMMNWKKQKKIYFREVKRLGRQRKGGVPLGAIHQHSDSPTVIVIPPRKDGK